MSAETPQPDLSALAGINRLIHNPARLQPLAQLYVPESAGFLFCCGRLVWREATSRCAYASSRQPGTCLLKGRSSIDCRWASAA